MKTGCIGKLVSALSGSTGTQCLLLYCEYHYCNMNIINNILIMSFPEICMYSIRMHNYYLYMSCMNACIRVATAPAYLTPTNGSDVIFCKASCLIFDFSKHSHCKN